MAPLLTALVPFLLLPALLAALGSPAALPFAGFAVAVLLLVPAAQVVIGLARLPILCLGGIAALGASAMPLLIFDLDWRPAIALAAAPAARPDRRRPALASGARPQPGAGGRADAAAAAGAGRAAGGDRRCRPQPAGLRARSRCCSCRSAWRWSCSSWFASFWRHLQHGCTRQPRSATLPADGLGLDSRAVALTACLLAGALSAIGGALMALGPAPIITVDAARLGGALLGAGGDRPARRHPPRCRPARCVAVVAACPSSRWRWRRASST